MKNNTNLSTCIEQPNKETIKAMLEAEYVVHDPDMKRYSDVEEALRVLKV